MGCVSFRDIKKCEETLRCGHECSSVKGCECLCLDKKCVKGGDQHKEDCCTICYANELGNSPCIKLECGHVFHAKCIRRRTIRTGKGPPKISFNHLECPICKALSPFSHPFLKVDLAPQRHLYQKVQENALQRLKIEGFEYSPELAYGGAYYGNETGFALSKFQYYSCAKCSKPYFGGLRDCEENNDGDSNASDAHVCDSCTSHNVLACHIHGNEFVQHKCKFCCSVAKWYCWGNTHFCDNCHKNANVIARTPQSSLSPCVGGLGCPLNVDKHALAGEEFILGCSICRADEQSRIQNQTGFMFRPCQE